MARARSAATPRSGPPLQWPLVGRHQELELFSDTLIDPRAHGFVIHGPPGVGKTRLADQCLALADQAGRNVARATATEGSCEVPLGALAHLLPAGLGDERCDLVAVVSQIRSVLQDQSSTGPLVLFVDDLHLLDSTSATLVGQLVDADLLFLVATVRSTESVPRGLESLWHKARVRRVDLDDLDRVAVDTLVHLILRGPVEASTVTELWTASQGNVLFVRELVLAGLDGGQLVEQRGVWRLVSPLVATPRLHELLAARLGCLPPEVADALDVLAVWEPTGLSTLEETVGPGPLEHLDRAGLIAVRADGRRQQVTLAHPLYGEILRGRMPALTRRRLLLALADRIDAYGARRREDAVRVATARLEATGWADPALLVRAARLARYGQDFVHVERLGQAALLGGMTPEAGLLVGEALHELGRFDEAEQVLSDASAQETEDGALRRAAHRDPLAQPDVGAVALRRRPRRQPGQSHPGGGPGRHGGAGPQRGTPARLLRAAAGRTRRRWPPSRRRPAHEPGPCARSPRYRRWWGQDGASGLPTRRPGPSPSTRRCPSRSPSPVPACTSSPRSTRWPSAAGWPRRARWRWRPTRARRPTRRPTR